jgi:ribosomal protein S6--L-glutamate ligase
MDTIESAPPDNRPVAIGARLRQFSGIQTLGFKPNFHAYSAEEKKRILGAKKIYYPTAFYADLFNTMGKKTFPSFHTYKFALDKIKQTAAFQMHGIPHPRTRVFYGKKQIQTILDYFTFPFIGKKARGSAMGRGIFLIKTPEDLSRYLDLHRPAYIQEYLPIEKDMRIIIIGQKIRLSYWRISRPNHFKTNVSQGSTISFEPIPKGALNLAGLTALKCGWDDVGIDIIQQRNKFYVLEGNMKYGTKGFSKAGIPYKQFLASLIMEGRV